MEPLNEEILMKVIEEIMNRESFNELEDVDPMIAMAILELIEDSVRIYHRKTVENYFKEMDKEYSSKL